MFVGAVTARRVKVIDPEYFGQNVRKMLVTFSIESWVKGSEVQETEVLAPISVACERFYVSNEYLVFSNFVNGTYRIDYCVGAKRMDSTLESELDLLNEAAATSRAINKKVE